MHSLPRRLSHCILNAEPFERGGEYVSFLDTQGNRKDYCPACWSQTDRPNEGHYWRGKVPLKKEKAPDPDEKALHLFRHACHPKQKYILALYLLRKQQLVQRTKTLYEIPETGEVFDVEKVALSQEESEHFAEEITLLINGQPTQ